MSTQYRVYCVPEGRFVYTWSDTKPTECPNNSNHPIRAVLFVKESTINETEGLISNANKISIGGPVNENYELSVTSATNNGVLIKTGNSSATAALDVQDASGNPLFYVNGSGHVGIRTNNPQYSLDVSGTVNFRGQVAGVSKFITMNTRKEIKSQTYEDIDDVIFLGNNGMSTIQSVHVVASSTGAEYSVRLYDLTNARIIAEKTGLTNTEKEVIDLGTISNIPTNKAVLELHIKRTTGAGTAKIKYYSTTIQIT